MNLVDQRCGSATGAFVSQDLGGAAVPGLQLHFAAFAAGFFRRVRIVGVAGFFIVVLGLLFCGVENPVFVRQFAVGEVARNCVQDAGTYGALSSRSRADAADNKWWDRPDP